MKKEKSGLDNIQFQEVLDALTSHIAILDEQGDIVAVNAAWRKFGQMNGFVGANFGVGDNYLRVCDHTTGEDRDSANQVAAAIRRIISGEITEEFIEYPCHAPDQQRWFQVKISRFLGGSNHVILIHQNITTRKTAEDLLIANEWKFRNIIEQSSEGIVLVDTEGRIIEWNHAEEVITGMTKEEVSGRFVWDVQSELVSKEAADKFREISKDMIIALLKKGDTTWAGKPSYFKIIRKDGKVAEIQSSMFAIKHNHGYMACGMYRDITEFKKAKQEQKLLENRFRTYVNFSPVIALVVERSGKFVDVNPEACQKLGYSEEELLSMTMPEITPPEESENSARLLAELLEFGHASSQIRLIKKDQTYITLSSNAVTLPDGNLMVLCTDITELIHTHNDLQESKAFLQNILDNIPSLITVKDAQNFKFFKVNRPMENYLQKTEEEILGKTAFDIFSPLEAEYFSKLDHQVLEAKKIIETPTEELTIGNGEKRILQEKKIPMFDDHGNPRFILSIADDITEKIGLETVSSAQFLRLEAVNKLSTALQKVQTLEDLYPVFSGILLQVFKASMASIWLHDREKRILKPVFHLNGEADLDLFGKEPIMPGRGIIGTVFVNKQPHISSNYAYDPLVQSGSNKEVIPLRGGVAAPLRTTNSVLGVINLSVDLDRSITDEDVRLLVTLSEIAGNAIQNINLMKQTEQRLSRISAISTIDRAITSSLDLQVSFEILVSNLVSLLDVAAADILLFNQHSQLLEYSIGQGFKTGSEKTSSVRLGQSFAGEAAINRHILITNAIEDIKDDDFRRFMKAENFNGYVGIPLFAKGQLKGVLEVFSHSKLDPDEDWINFLQSLSEQASIAIDNTQMFENLQRSNTELSLAYNATIEGWSRALDLRDEETEGHTLRVTEITERLARAMQFQESQIKYIRWGALLHDIGKLGVPDNILLKSGPLTDEEWIIMRKHPQFAFDMLSPIGYLRRSIEIPYCHHEKWDGTGYPRGLKGEEIPLAARIFAVVDIWDALNSDRPYRKAWPKEKVIEHLKSLSGTHLDPKVVTLCLNSGFLNG